MGFDGSLIKVGSKIFPLKYVYKESYSITPNRRMDLDSDRMGDGVLTRNVLEHRPSTISFQTKPMWNHELSEMMKFIRDNYIDEKEKKISLTYYCPDIDDYKVGDFYIPDTEFPINLVDTVNKKILYNSFTLEFIEY